MFNEDRFERGYDSFVSAKWDYINQAVCEQCDECKSDIPTALAVYGKVDEDKVFCSRLCRYQWEKENAWEYDL